ncbi:MAG TPA: hypothetical protein VGE10_06975 [Zeimonas sp.]
MNERRRALVGAGCACVCAFVPAGAKARTTADGAFAFALIGDLPYNALEVRVLQAVFESFDRDLDFALHVGDIKASWEPCSDELLEARLRLLESCPVPLVYVPGDNEWTDCARARAGHHDPRERLEWLRERAFGARASLPVHSKADAGNRLPALDGIERHCDRFADGLAENLRWVRRAVRFVTVNLPGSNNGLNAYGLGRGDWERRVRANAQWLLDSYRVAADEQAAAVVVVAHANPNFGAATRSPWSIDGYASFRSSLVDASNRFAGPTLFAHGDTHRHRVERITPKLLRVESHGSPFSDRWVRIDVAPRAPQPFRITARSARLGTREPLALA